MKHIRRINESQYKKLFLNEEMHYPAFLDGIKETVSNQLIKYIGDMIKHNIMDHSFVIRLDCEYTDELVIEIHMFQSDSIDDERDYFVIYINERNRLVNGKLYHPKIKIQCPICKKKYNPLELHYRIAHEVTHLYDDWMSLRNGNGGICQNKINSDTEDFVRRVMRENSDKYLVDLAFLCYMSLKVERQAFLSQTIQELEYLGCTRGNYKDVLKRTSTYKNLNKSYCGVIDFLDASGDDTLSRINIFIVESFPKASIPKLNLGDFDPNRYRQMLSKWAKRIYHNTMKSYGSVVQYYIQKLDEEFYRNSDYFVI